MRHNLLSYNAFQIDDPSNRVSHYVTFAMSGAMLTETRETTCECFYCGHVGRHLVISATTKRELLECQFCKLQFFNEG